MFWIGLFVGIAITGMAVMVGLAWGLHSIDYKVDEFVKGIVSRGRTTKEATND
jgi:hypothetical protein